MLQYKTKKLLLTESGMFPSIKPQDQPENIEFNHSQIISNKISHQPNTFQPTSRLKPLWRDWQRSQKNSSSTLLQQLRDDNLSQKSFQQNWKKMTSILQSHILFSNYFPVPLSQEGASLLNNGLFIIHWLQVMKQCSFVCFPILFDHAARKYKNCAQNGQEFAEYVFKQPNGKQTMKMQNRFGCDWEMKRSKQQFQQFPQQKQRKLDREEQATESEQAIQFF